MISMERTISRLETTMERQVFAGGRISKRNAKWLKKLKQQRNMGLRIKRG